MQRGLVAFNQLVDRFGHLAHQGVCLTLKIVALHARITLRDQHAHDQQRADDQEFHKRRGASGSENCGTASRPLKAAATQYPRL